MRVVVDEGVPRQLVQALREVGLAADRFRDDWKQITNGELIRAAEAEGYAVLLTNDKNMADQQSLEGKSLAVVALPLNRRAAVMARVGDIADTIRRAKPGQHVVMGLDGTRFATIATGGEVIVEEMPRVPPLGLF